MEHEKFTMSSNTANVISDICLCYLVLLLFMEETFIIIDMILSKHNFTKNKQHRCIMHSHSTIVGVITMLMGGAQYNVTSFKQAGSKRDHLSAFNSVQFRQFIVIVEIKYFLNLNEQYLPIFILSIHFRQISFFLNHQRHSE